VWRSGGPGHAGAGAPEAPALVYGLSFVLMVIAATALAITVGPDPTVVRAVGAGLIIGVG
jgi:hypothetical protein